MCCGPPILRGGRWAAFLGQIGFALFALVLVLGLFTSTGAAAAYAEASNATTQASVAHDFATSFAIETLLSRVLGGVLVTVFLVVTSMRMLATRLLPPWVAYLGLLTAALLAATAALSTLAPDDPGVPTAGLSLLALGLWLIVVGVLLARLRALPKVPPRLNHSLDAGRATTRDRRGANRQAGAQSAPARMRL